MFLFLDIVVVQTQMAAILIVKPESIILIIMAMIAIGAELLF